MKLLFTLLFIVLAYPVKSGIIELKIDGYKIALFSKHEPLVFYDTVYRWTPLKQDVVNGLKILNNYLDEQKKNKNYINQGISRCPIIYNNRKKYYYQIFGRLNENGDFLLFVNVLWKKSDIRDKYKKEYIYVLDGCSYYWSIMINLTNKEAYNFWVNGLA
jgi:hypothetical protein